MNLYLTLSKTEDTGEIHRRISDMEKKINSEIPGRQV
jgi:hypothetical protein